jgi:proliferating cell nuclear antigen
MNTNDEVQISSEIKFKIKTIQSNSIKNLIESLKDILTDTNIEISQNGLKIIAMDPSHTVLVHLKLESKEFQEFICNEEMILGVNMINFYKLIKFIGNNDTLTLFVEKNNESQLNIIMESSDKNCITKYKLNLMDIPRENVEIPNLVFNSIITMPSGDFQKLCRDLHNISNTVDIKSVNNKLIFCSTGNIGSVEHIILENNNTLSVNENNLDEGHITQGNFLLKHLVMFTKCTSLSPTVLLYLKNDFPLIIEYKISSLGCIRLCLAPISNDDD